MKTIMPTGLNNIMLEIINFFSQQHWKVSSEIVVNVWRVLVCKIVRVNVTRFVDYSSVLINDDKSNYSCIQFTRH